MTAITPSIFNDIIGPVMRGPSSSHTAASVRIGNLVRQICREQISSVHVSFDPCGSLAHTYQGHGSDLGLAAGLLGFETDDQNLVDALEIIKTKNFELIFAITDLQADHPNTYRIAVADQQGNQYLLNFISTGGGMIELNHFNGFNLSVLGDYYELLIVLNPKKICLPSIQGQLETFLGDWEIRVVSHDQDMVLFNYKLTCLPDLDQLKAIIKPDNFVDLLVLEPFLPILSSAKLKIPFTNPQEALAYADKHQLSTWELAVHFESQRGMISEAEVFRMGNDILTRMKDSIKQGFNTKEYSNRILGPQAIKMSETKRALYGGRALKKLTAYITAIMESKSAMGIIVAAPTAGSCAALPGTLIALAEENGLADQEIVKGLFAAALIGIFIAQKSTFAAEECGCQAECGAGSAMAAAGLVEMLGGTVTEVFDAAAMAMQNILGLICDPVAERVEVPCLGKNILAGYNALAAANMALAGYDKVIPLEETIEAFDQVGRMMPSALRCTGKGGLSTTKTALSIDRELQSK